MAHVSIVIPTHNRRALVQEAVASALTQTHADREVIVVDDGSTDGTAPALRESFGERILLLEQECRGVSAARNAGIARGRGPWYAFLDSDDLWAPRKLELQCAALESAPQALACHTDETWIRAGRRVNACARHRKRGGEQFAAALRMCLISPSAVVLHRRAFEAVGLFDESLLVCEDYDLWLRLCARFPVLHVAQELTIKRGGHADQLSRRMWGMDRFRVMALEKIIGRGELSPEQRGAAVGELVRKASILLQGARKRGLAVDSGYYQGKIDRWTYYTKQ